LEHLPGLSLVTSGCMGQTYDLDAVSIFFKFMPHLEHLPCLSLVTSGCMGQLYIFVFVVSCPGAFDLLLFSAWAKSETGPMVIAAITSIIIFFMVVVFYVKGLIECIGHMGMPKARQIICLAKKGIFNLYSENAVADINR